MLQQGGRHRGNRSIKTFAVNPRCTQNQVPSVGQGFRGNQHGESKLPLLLGHLLEIPDHLFRERRGTYQRFESHVNTPFGLAVKLSRITRASPARYLPGDSYRCSGFQATALDQLSNSPLFFLTSISGLNPASTFSCSKL